MSTFASLLSSALTDPILLPQTVTLKCLSFKNLTAISTSLDYFFPKEINFSSVRLPQPGKSKHARPTSLGR